MSNLDCTALLQWALPRLELHWPGFRKVRGQVCKRLARRMRDLGLSNFAAYRARLEADPTEWRVLDESCHITISRFFRNRGIFEALRTRVLPEIAARAGREGRPARIWSAGCASGEEAYTVRIIWDVELATVYPAVCLVITASDVDDTMLARAREGCFAAASLRELPAPLVALGFERVGSSYCVRSPYREGIEFLNQDLRSDMPPHLFDLILCRYVAFTYFTLSLRRRVLARMIERLRPGGFLVIGAHEELPAAVPGLRPVTGHRRIFQKRMDVQELAG